MQHNSYRRWITLAIISFSGGVSFDLAYLRYIYQIPMAKFMGFSNTEIGLIMSTFGIAAIILYAPSGVIADKFSHRKMITSAMIITGLLGLLMATYPPLWVMLCIQVAFAITTILMLWSVSIKAASLLGDHSEQGKIMGWMEGLRGVGVMSLAVFTMWVFSRFAPDDSTSLKTVIIIYSVVYILLGILCWFFVSDNNNLRSANNEEKQSFQLSDILAVLRISTTWYCSMVIFGVFTIYAILSYSTNYLTEMYGMSLVAASYMGIVINKIFRALCGPLGGIITTYSKVKSPTRVIQILSIIGLLALTALLVTNSNPGDWPDFTAGIHLLRLTRAVLGLPRRSENTVLHYGHHGRYLFGDWIPAGCLRLPDYRPLARHPARCRSLPQYVADGHGGARHGDCLYLFAVPKNSYC